jgi:hypothetical protein
MPYLDNSTNVKPGIPFPLTFQWFHNRHLDFCDRSADCLIGHCRHDQNRWIKAASFSGDYQTQAVVGTRARKPQWKTEGYHPAPAGRRSKPWWGDEWGHQPSIVLGRRYGYFCIDVDSEALFTRHALVAQLVSREQRISQSRPGHWHVLVWVPEELRGHWPDRDVPGANCMGVGDAFIPVPGAHHYSGSVYEPGPGGVVVASKELLQAIQDQRVTGETRKAGYSGGSANGRQYRLLCEFMKVLTPAGGDKALEQWWWDRYDEMSAQPGSDGTYRDIDADPDGLFERHWSFRKRNYSGLDEASLPVWARA